MGSSRSRISSDSLWAQGASPRQGQELEAWSTRPVLRTYGQQHRSLKGPGTSSQSRATVPSPADHWKSPENWLFIPVPSSTWPLNQNSPGAKMVSYSQLPEQLGLKKKLAPAGVLNLGWKFLIPRPCSISVTQHPGVGYRSQWFFKVLRWFQRAAKAAAAGFGPCLFQVWPPGLEHWHSQGAC